MSLFHIDYRKINKDSCFYSFFYLFFIKVLVGRSKPLQMCSNKTIREQNIGLSFIFIMLSLNEIELETVTSLICLMNQTLCIKLWFKYKWEISECPWGRLEVRKESKTSNEVVTAAVALSARGGERSCSSTATANSTETEWKDSWVLSQLLMSGLQVKYCTGKQAWQWT